MIKSALHLYLFHAKVTAVQSWNGIYAFLRRIPSIGKKIPRSFYNKIELKESFAVIVLILRLLTKPIVKGFILWILSIGINFLSGDYLSRTNLTVSETTVMFWMVLCSFFVGAFQYAYLLTDEDINFMRNYHTPRDLFWYSQSYVPFFFSFVAYLLIFCGVWKIQDVPFVIVVNALGFYLSSFLMGEMLRRIFFIFQPSKIKKRVMVAGVCLFYVSTALLILYLPWKYQFNILRSPWLFLLFIAIGSCYLVVRRKLNVQRYFQEIILKSLDSNNTIEKIHTNADMIEMQESKKQLQHTVFDVRMFFKTNSLDYLLFKRQRKWYLKALSIKAGFLFVLCCLPFFVASPSEGTTVQLLIPYLSIIFINPLGKKLVAGSFINCDSSLLYYPFYRQKKVILSGLCYRLKRLFYCNSILGVEVFLFMLVAAYLNQTPKTVHLLISLIIFLMAITFLASSHYLFTYYLLQPFNESGKVVNPVYSIVNFLESGVFFILYKSDEVANKLFLAVGSEKVLYMISGLLCLYVIIGMIVIYHLAPKTFRIKK